MIKETLEEAAEKYFKKVSPNICFYDATRFGAKWQQERSYSQLDVVRILSKYETLNNEDFNKWFEQFKK